MRPLARDGFSVVTVTTQTSDTDVLRSFEIFVGVTAFETSGERSANRKASAVLLDVCRRE